ncbi:dTDP-4-dehydrorhamnose 3,5-epimerase family protein [Pseudohoeflea coraliihabitans]|uniref:dTDP-4-dehydrorhamnose 3,5-epimerase n=1 Tax=Pseudohoeflea coraliihabitans TaxID=2860393 RepID=A0ABS6WNN9_9HYPH|nr:dTDP-4-dehydrorhamnose 3,5-epimerase [Pseudohoeflea sp. DP4N28-3]MBW3097510.1 dTDP-4-dehydrorhamnose 3,5-epimerase [Pseudohoeflea sp. DP4N28-3]
MKLEVTPLQGGPSPVPALVRRSAFRDARGVFSRLFALEELAPFGWSDGIAHINHSATPHAGTVRGLHFQEPPHAEMKLVTVLQGKIFDVIVDMRKDSPNRFLPLTVELSAETGTALLIPQGFAHGFQTLTDDVALLYLHSAAYAPAAARGLRPDDPALSISWPLPLKHCSEQDRAWPLIGHRQGS